MDNLRQAVETAKRILTKEKIGRQLAGQSSLTPFMAIRDGYISKKVTFNMQDILEDKIDRLTSMMNILTTHNDNENKQFKPRICQNKFRGQPRNFYPQNNYDQRNYQIDIGQIAEIEELQAEIEVSMERIMEEDCFMLISIETIIEEIISEIHKII